MNKKSITLFVSDAEIQSCNQRELKITFKPSIDSIVAALILECGAVDFAKSVHEYDPAIALDICRHVKSLNAEYEETYG